MADLSNNSMQRYSLSPRAAVDSALGQVSAAVSTASAATFQGQGVSGGISFSPVSVVQAGDGTWQMGGGLNFDIPLASIQQFQNNALAFSAANSAANKSAIAAASDQSASGISAAVKSAGAGLLGLFDASNAGIASAAASSRAYLAGMGGTVDSTLSSVSQRAMGLTGTALSASERIAMANAQVAENTANQMFATVRYQEEQNTKRTQIQMQNTGGGGGLCFFTTAVCDHWGLADDCHYLSVLREFRDTVMVENATWAELVKQYKREAPHIVQGIADLPEQESIWEFVGNTYIIPCVELVESCDYEKAISMYRRMFHMLKSLAKSEG